MTIASSPTNSATRSRAVIHGDVRHAEPEPGGERVEQGEGRVAPELHRAQRAAELDDLAARGRAWAIRSRCRVSSAAHTAALNPKVIGSPGWPWVRPHITVSRCRRASVQRRRPRSGRRRGRRCRATRRMTTRDPGVGHVLHGGAVVDPLAGVLGQHASAGRGSGRAWSARWRGCRAATSSRSSASTSRVGGDRLGRVGGISPTLGLGLGQRGEDVQPAPGCGRASSKQRVQLRASTTGGRRRRSRPGARSRSLARSASGRPVEPSQQQLPQPLADLVEVGAPRHDGRVAVDLEPAFEQAALGQASAPLGTSAGRGPAGTGRPGRGSSP